MEFLSNTAYDSREGSAVNEDRENVRNALPTGHLLRGTCKNCSACCTDGVQKKDVQKKKKYEINHQRLEKLRQLVNERRASKRHKKFLDLHLRPRAKQKQENVQNTRTGYDSETQPQGMMHGEGPPFLSSWPAFSPQYQQNFSGLKPATSSPSVAALPNKLYPSGLESAALPGWYNAQFGRPLGADPTAFAPNLHRTNGYQLPSIPDTSMIKHADIDTRQLSHLSQLQHHTTPKLDQESSRQPAVSEKQEPGPVEKVNGYPSHSSASEMYRSGYQQKTTEPAHRFPYSGGGMFEQQKQRAASGTMEPPPSYEEYVKHLSHPRKPTEQESSTAVERYSAGLQGNHKSQYGHPNTQQTPSSFTESTSVNPPLPVISSADKHMISYYLQGQRMGQADSNNIQSDKARKVAEEIMGEASFSMSRKQELHPPSHGVHSSPFPNISNMFGTDQQRQQHPSSFEKTDSSTYPPADPHGLPSRPNSRPQSNHSVSSMDMNQTNARPDHPVVGRNQNVFNTAPTGAKDFWSQFGLPPPNVVVNTQSSQQPGPALPEIARPQSATLHETNPHTTYNKPDASVKTPEKKRGEKSKKKSSPVNSATHEEVEAKVQQILAAIRQSGQKQQPLPDKPATPQLAVGEHNPQQGQLQDTNQYREGGHDNKRMSFDSHARQMELQKMQYTSPINSQGPAGHHIPSPKPGETAPFNSHNRHNSPMSFNYGKNYGSSSDIGKIMFNKPLSGGVQERVQDQSGPQHNTAAGLHNNNTSLTLPQQVNAVQQLKSDSPHEPTYHLQNPLALAQQVKDSRHFTTDPSQNNEPTYHLQKNPHSLAQQVQDIRQLKKDGRLSPCCSNCDKLGVRFSPHCQNHTKQQFDPYAFNDEMDFKPPNKYRSVCQKEQLVNNPYKFVKELEQNRMLGNQDKIVQQKRMKMLASENRNSFMPKNLYDQRKVEFSQQLNKPQGFNSGKKLGSKMYNVYKSPSLLYYKKTLKNQQNKLSGAKKPNGKLTVNGKKTKKTTADAEFARNLVKNLGFPPLTREDLISKRQGKLPAKEFNENLSLSSSANVDKTNVIPSVANKQNHVKVEVPDLAVNSVGFNNHAVNVKQENSVQHPTGIMKTLIRSASFENLDQINGVYGQPLKRSRSFSGEHELRHEEFKCGGGSDGSMDMKCVVDDKLVDSGALPNGHMTSMTDHIQGLQKKVTGNNDHLYSNTVIEVPKCGCLGPDYVFNEAVEGPYYTHLGAGRSVEAVRIMLEKRLGVTGKAIRIEKVRYTGKEGKSTQGCPIAKWIIRRSSLEEKYLAVLRHRVNHHCETAWLIIGLVAWEGVPAQQADDLYDFLSTNLPENGFETERRCGTNEQKMCACQGVDLMKRGASFSFGCSWSMYYNSCKFARSHNARRFKLKNVDVEAPLESKLQDLATHVGPLYQECAPEAHSNQSLFSEKAQDCRLGRKPGGPFSGVTACVDFCAHAHRDTHNMNNGSTVVVTLTKHRGLSKPDDEQLHVLPLYVMEPTDEAGSFDGQYDKIQNGALEVLHHYPLEARIRSHPLMSCKKRRQLQAKSPGGRKKRGGHTASSGRQSPWGSSSSTQSTPKKGKWDSPVLHSQDSNQSFSSQSGSLGGTPVKQNHSNNNTMMMNGTHEKPITYEELMALSTEAGFEGLYERFWNYFYMYGAFPPTSFVKGHFRSGPSWNNNSAANGQTTTCNWSRNCEQSPGVTQQHSEVASSVGKNCGTNAVPFEQSQLAAKRSEQTTDLPQAQQKDTVHLTDPFSDGTSSSHRIPHQSTVDPVGQLPPSSNSQSGTGFPHAPQSTQSGGGKPDTSTLPQNCAMDLSSSTSYQNNNISTGHQQVHAHTSAPPPAAASQPLISQENSHATPDPYTHSRHVEHHLPSAGDTRTSSPLALLSQTVEMMRSKDVGYKHPLSALEDHPLIRQQMNADRAVETQQQQQRAAVPPTNGGQHRMENTHPQSAGSGQAQVHTRDTNIHNSVPIAADRVQCQSSAPDQFKTPVTQAEYNSANIIHGNITNTAHYGDHQHNQYGSTKPLQEQQNQNSGYENSHSLENNKAMHPNHYPTNHHPSHHQEPQKFVHSDNQHQLNMNHEQTHQSMDYFHNYGNMESNPGYENVTKSSLDPDVVKCQMEYNEEAFRDPNIGGVAVALGHGAVLFEVAKRELHATTGLKKPNRYHPTRISLVFYQHKNLNYEKHGMYAYLKKMEDLKRERIEKMQAERGYVNMMEIENSFKGGKKRKLDSENVKGKVEEEPVFDIRKSSAAYYRYMWDCDTKRHQSRTTDTLSQKWISPQPMVTGPYQKWV